MEWKENIATLNLPHPLLERLDMKKAQLDAMRPLPGIAVKRLRETIAIEWTYHSNAIEGNTLDLVETKLVIEEGITIKGKSLREHLEVVNHYEAIDKVVALAQPDSIISEKIILDLHSLILEKIEKDYAGRYRNFAVRIVGANFVPPNHVKVPELMTDLVEWLQQNPLRLHPLLLATAFHHRFVFIHPFADGNGRTVRLLFNLMLMAKGYPPAVILKQDRQKYYRALHQADTGTLAPLALLMVQAAERTLDIYQSNFDGNAEDYMPIGDLAQEPDMPYGEEYLGLLARRGKIDAYKEGKRWFTTKRAIEDYRLRRQRMR
jgi:Fic family protein